MPNCLREGRGEFPAPVAELLLRLFAWLKLHAGEIDGFGKDAGRGAGLQTAKSKPQRSFKSSGKR